MSANYFDIGTIVNSHGIQGELRVMPSTDDPSRFGLLDAVEVFFEGLANGRSYPIESARQHKSLVVLKLAGVDTRNEAERMVGGILKIPPEKALPLAEDEYYHRDLLDMCVLTEQGEVLGKLVRILETGANDVYVVQPEAKGAKEILLPAIKDCLREVSVPDKRMVVHLMEGLR